MEIQERYVVHKLEERLVREAAVAEKPLKLAGLVWRRGVVCDVCVWVVPPHGRLVDLRAGV